MNQGVTKSYGNHRGLELQQYHIIYESSYIFLYIVISVVQSKYWDFMWYNTSKFSSISYHTTSYDINTDFY